MQFKTSIGTTKLAQLLLLTNPDLILFDEPSEGLAPMIVRQISQVIHDLRDKISGILAEQNIKMAMKLADHVYIISKGQIVYEGTPHDLQKDEDIMDLHLGVKTETRGSSQES